MTGQAVPSKDCRPSRPNLLEAEDLLPPNNPPNDPFSNRTLARYHLRQKATGRVPHVRTRVRGPKTTGEAPTNDFPEFPWRPPRTYPRSILLSSQMPGSGSLTRVTTRKRTSGRRPTTQMPRYLSIGRILDTCPKTRFPYVTGIISECGQSRPRVRKSSFSNVQRRTATAITGGGTDISICSQTWRRFRKK